MIPEPTQVTTTGFISPNTLYYIALYGVVILVRFFKVKKSSDPSAEWDWRPVFHVALEIVYTSSGLVILLLQGLRTYAAFIIIVYSMLVIISSQIEFMEEKFSKKAAFYTHIGISAVVAITTIVYFEFVEREIERQHISAARTAAERLKTYRVLIPYDDQTLRGHIGQRLFGGRQLVQIISVSSKNATEAREKALRRFYEIVTPFKEVEDSTKVLFILLDRITVELDSR